MVLGGLTPANKLDGARCLRKFSTRVAIYAVGGGLLEVLVSPIVEHLPTPAGQKASGMALLNSCYCWGQVAVVVGTTIVLGLLGPGLFALLMGIGRFAFTPMMPLMVRDGSLDAVTGTEWATANYVGYLLGAISASWFARSPRLGLQVGLVGVAATTLAMAWGDAALP